MALRKSPSRARVPPFFSLCCLAAEVAPEQATTGGLPPPRLVSSGDAISNQEMILFNRRTEARSTVDLFEFLQKCVIAYFLHPRPRLLITTQHRGSAP